MSWLVEASKVTSGLSLKTTETSRRPRWSMCEPALSIGSRLSIRDIAQASPIGK